MYIMFCVNNSISAFHQIRMVFFRIGAHFPAAIFFCPELASWMF